MKLLEKIWCKTTSTIKSVHQWFKKTRICKKVWQWLLYGVTISFIPYWIVQLTNLFLGYPISIRDTFPDYLLIAFCVAGNALSIIEDTDKKIKSDTRIHFQHLSGFTFFITVVLYTVLFNDGFATSFIDVIIEKNPLGLIIAKQIINVLLLINILGVIIFEVKSSNAELKEDNISETNSAENEK